MKSQSFNPTGFEGVDHDLFDHNENLLFPLIPGPQPICGLETCNVACA